MIQAAMKVKVEDAERRRLQAFSNALYGIGDGSAGGWTFETLLRN
jgi:hypothetical protein